MPGVPRSGLGVDHSVEPSLAPRELRRRPVGIGHLADVCKAPDRVGCLSVDVPGNIGVRLVNMAADTRPPVLEMRPGWIHRRTESVDQFRSALGHLEIARDVIRHPLDLALLEFSLGRLSELRASFAHDAIRAVRRVHPDPVVVIAEG